MLLIAPTAADFQTAHELVGEADRLWFRRHRRRQFRLRAIAPVERVTLSAPEASHILVEHIGRGFRVRWPVAITGTLAGTSEALARMTGEGGA